MIVFVPLVFFLVQGSHNTKKRPNIAYKRLSLIGWLLRGKKSDQRRDESVDFKNSVKACRGWKGVTSLIGQSHLSAFLI